MACQIWHGIWYGLASMTWYTVLPGLAGNGMVYGMAWRAMAWYGLAGKAWYMVWPGMHEIVHGMA